MALCFGALCGLSDDSSDLASRLLQAANSDVLDLDGVDEFAGREVSKDDSSGLGAREASAILRKLIRQVRAEKESGKFGAIMTFDACSVAVLRDDHPWRGYLSRQDSCFFVKELLEVFAPSSTKTESPAKSIPETPADGTAAGEAETPAAATGPTHILAQALRLWFDSLPPDKQELHRPEVFAKIGDQKLTCYGKDLSMRKPLAEQQLQQLRLKAQGFATKGNREIQSVVRAALATGSIAVITISMVDAPPMDFQAFVEKGIIPSFGGGFVRRVRTIMDEVLDKVTGAPEKCSEFSAKTLLNTLFWKLREFAKEQHKGSIAVIADMLGSLVKLETQREDDDEEDGALGGGPRLVGGERCAFDFLQHALLSTAGGGTPSRQKNRVWRDTVLNLMLKYITDVDAGFKMPKKSLKAFSDVSIRGLCNASQKSRTDAKSVLRAFANSCKEPPIEFVCSCFLQRQFRRDRCELGLQDAVEVECAQPEPATDAGGREPLAAGEGCLTSHWQPRTLTEYEERFLRKIFEKSSRDGCDKVTKEDFTMVVRKNPEVSRFFGVLDDDQDIENLFPYWNEPGTWEEFRDFYQRDTEEPGPCSNRKLSVSGSIPSLRSTSTNRDVDGANLVPPPGDNDSRSSTPEAEVAADQVDAFEPISDSSAELALGPDRSMKRSMGQESSAAGVLGMFSQKSLQEMDAERPAPLPVFQNTTEIRAFSGDVDCRTVEHRGSDETLISAVKNRPESMCFGGSSDVSNDFAETDQADEAGFSAKAINTQTREVALGTTGRTACVVQDPVATPRTGGIYQIGSGMLSSGQSQLVHADNTTPLEIADQSPRISARVDTGPTMAQKLAASMGVVGFSMDSEITTFVNSQVAPVTSLSSATDASACHGEECDIPLRMERFETFGNEGTLDEVCLEQNQVDQSAASDGHKVWCVDPPPDGDSASGQSRGQPSTGCDGSIKACSLPATLSGNSSGRRGSSELGAQISLRSASAAQTTLDCARASPLPVEATPVEASSPALSRISASHSYLDHLEDIRQETIAMKTQLFQASAMLDDSLRSNKSEIPDGTTCSQQAQPQPQQNSPLRVPGGQVSELTPQLAHAVQEGQRSHSTSEPIAAKNPQGGANLLEPIVQTLLQESKQTQDSILKMLFQEKNSTQDVIMQMLVQEKQQKQEVLQQKQDLQDRMTALERKNEELAQHIASAPRQRSAMDAAVAPGVADATNAQAILQTTASAGAFTDAGNAQAVFQAPAPSPSYPQTSGLGHDTSGCGFMGHGFPDLQQFPYPCLPGCGYSAPSAYTNQHGPLVSINFGTQGLDGPFSGSRNQKVIDLEVARPDSAAPVVSQISSPPTAKQVQPVVTPLSRGGHGHVPQHVPQPQPQQHPPQQAFEAPPLSAHQGIVKGDVVDLVRDAVLSVVPSIMQSAFDAGLQARVGDKPQAFADDCRTLSRASTPPELQSQGFAPQMQQEMQSIVSEMRLAGRAIGSELRVACEALQSTQQSLRRQAAIPSPPQAGFGGNLQPPLPVLGVAMPNLPNNSADAPFAPSMVTANPFLVTEPCTTPVPPQFFRQEPVATPTFAPNWDNLPYGAGASTQPPTFAPNWDQLAYGATASARPGPVRAIVQEGSSIPQLRSGSKPFSRGTCAPAVKTGAAAPARGTGAGRRAAQPTQRPRNTAIERRLKDLDSRLPALQAQLEHLGSLGRE